METFYDYIQQFDWDKVKKQIETTTAKDVERALSKTHRTVDDFAALISPAAIPYLEIMAEEAQRLTRERYGKVMQLYLPLYLSNICENYCIYCGFNCHNKIHRKKLSMEEIDREVEAIKKLGYDHLLLVSGEAPKISGVDYYEEAVRRIRPHFSQISLEVQPLNVEDYIRLRKAGVAYVCVYQETYNEKHYPLYHLRGQKSDYRYRLETPDRLGQADIQKIGIGALLGLEEWRVDAFFTALHLTYLEKKYWKTKYSISLPRLRPAVGSFEPKDPISDQGMVQLICAFRLLNQEVEISLSTRESSFFRDHVMTLGITSMSAGSSTEPGGYAEHHEELEQFHINDSRTPEAVVEAIRMRGLEPVWKDWAPWM